MSSLLPTQIRERAKPCEMSPPPFVEETIVNGAFRPSCTLRRPAPPSPSVLRAPVDNGLLYGKQASRCSANADMSVSRDDVEQTGSTTQPGVPCGARPCFIDCGQMLFKGTKGLFTPSRNKCIVSRWVQRALCYLDGIDTSFISPAATSTDVETGDEVEY